MSLTVFETEFGNFVFDDSAPYAILKFPPETFFTMTRTLAKAFEAIQKAGFVTCVLDMSGVVYLDSSSISTLLQFAAFASDHGGWLRIVNVNGSQHLRRLFQIIGLERSFKIYPSISAAAEGA